MKLFKFKIADEIVIAAPSLLEASEIARVQIAAYLDDTGGVSYREGVEIVSHGEIPGHFQHESPYGFAVNQKTCHKVLEEELESK